jgi:hypothetical protein
MPPIIATDPIAPGTPDPLSINGEIIACSAITLISRILPMMCLLVLDSQIARSDAIKIGKIDHNGLTKSLNST